MTRPMIVEGVPSVSPLVDADALGDLSDLDACRWWSLVARDQTEPGEHVRRDNATASHDTAL